MKHFLIIIILFSSIGLFSTDDETTAARLLKVKDRTLIVELPILDNEFIEYLKEHGKQNEIKKYESKSVEIRKNYRLAFEKFWKFNEKIIFVDSDSLEKSINGYYNYYAIIRYGKRNELLFGEKFVNSFTAPDFHENYMSLFLAEEEKEVLFCLTPFHSGLGEFIISIHQYTDAINVYLNHPDLKEKYVNAYTVARGDKKMYETKNKILLIKQGDIMEGDIIDDSRINKVYPYKYKVVNTKDWDDALYNESDDYSCYIYYSIGNIKTVYELKNVNLEEFRKSTLFPWYAKYLNDDFKNTILVMGSAAFLTRNGYGELSSGGKKIIEILADFKKLLDKFEALDKK